jgi:predicted transposase/invertase (TIGR01784 family)
VQPHDGFFKHALSNLTVAKYLLRAHLSPSIQQRIQWNYLKLSNKSYTDEKLAQLHSDVVYTCQIDEKSSYIYILLEQQTKPDPLLPFRFLQYNVALLAEHLSQNKKGQQKTKLPIILNLCLYSGKQTPYPYSVDIYDCFEAPVLAKS